MYIHVQYICDATMYIHVQCTYAIYHVYVYIVIHVYTVHVHCTCTIYMYIVYYVDIQYMTTDDVKPNFYILYNLHKHCIRLSIKLVV